MAKPPTLDDLQAERARFIGPPEPPRGPKMPRRPTEADEIYAEILVTVHLLKLALDADEPLDPNRLPEKIVEILEAQCVGQTLPVVDGRTHYPAIEVYNALSTRTGKASKP